MPRDINLNTQCILKNFREIYIMKRKVIFIFLLITFNINAFSQVTSKSSRIIPGAERMDVYLPLLKGKTVAVFANPTSVVQHTNLVDTLMKRGNKVVKIFGPEHGFRGDADAG